MKSRLIRAIAPTRICDVGGWTDTHFAKFGSVLNIAIYPYVEVQIRTEDVSVKQPRITISADNFGDEYDIDICKFKIEKHPLLETAIKIMPVPKDMSFKINIFSNAPPGASIGTSAAVSIALIGALNAFSKEFLTAHEIAKLAHNIETKELGLECGIQDQLASAYGRINFISMYEYPNASISHIETSEQFIWELEQRILLVYIGTPHNSSEIHKKVIKNLGENPSKDSRIESLRELAYEAKKSILCCDIDGLGETFNYNTELQRKLHKDLICKSFEEIIQISIEYGALGCKVNGAGGDGGSIVILTDGDLGKKRRLSNLLLNKGYHVLPINFSNHGLRVWEAT